MLSYKPFLNFYIYPSKHRQTKYTEKIFIIKYEHFTKSTKKIAQRSHSNYSFRI